MSEIVRATPQGLDAAAAAIAAGEVIVIPTDTVYGVAVDPLRPGATQRLFEAKQRPRDIPLPVLVGDPAEASRLGVLTPVAERIAARFWPGAVTIVVERRPEVDADLGLVEATVGLRCPDHDVARSLLRITGPLATTSANLHGEPTPPTAQAVAAVFGGSVSVVVDGGVCEGSPSTVVDCTGDEPALLRDGRVDFALLLDS